MNKFKVKLPEVYKLLNLYEQKKAKYSLLIILFVYTYATMMFIIDLVLYDNYVMIMSQFIGLTIYMAIVFALWHRGKMELAINMTVLAGLGFTIYLFFEASTIRYYMQILMVMLVTTAGYIKLYQFLLTYVVFAMFIILKIMTQFNDTTLIVNTSFWIEQIITVLGLFTVILSLHFLKIISERELKSADNLKKALESDDLTKLPNRRSFEEFILRNHGKFNLSFMMIDLDYFKKINDEFGHHFGDLILQQFAEQLKNTIRSVDYAFRWGGEEFVVVSINTNRSRSIEIAERIRESIELHEFSLKNRLTVSIGLSHIRKEDSVETMKHKFIQADEALYRAKVNGRNRIEVSELNDV